MVTRKDYRAIAEIIKKQTICPWEDDPFILGAAKDVACVYAEGLADYFATQNPKFNRQKFLNACGLGD